MRISRYLRYAILGALSLCAFSALSALAVERPVAYITAGMGELYGSAYVRHEAALATWQTQRADIDAGSAGALRAEGNHLVQASVPVRETPILN